MIIDTLDRIDTYRPVLRGIDEGLAAVRALGGDPQVGRYEFDGGYFMIQEGTTRDIPDGDFEAHRKYIDVQIILKGRETVAWSDIRCLTESVPYLDDKDKVMYAGEPAQCNTIGEGMFWAAFPQDGHKACRHMEAEAPAAYKKVVMKLPVA